MVEVADGYARNYLIPTQQAVIATTRNRSALEHQKRLIAEQIKKERSAAEGLAKRIEEIALTIPVQVGEEGKLFGSVTSKDVAEALAAAGVEVDKRKIVLEKPIKELGSATVPIRLGREVTAQLKIEVVRAEG